MAINWNMPIGRRDSAAPDGAKKAKRVVRRLPVKRTINLAAVNVKRINWFIAVPLILLILVGSTVLSHFTVVERMNEIDRAHADVERLRAELDSGYRRLDTLGSFYRNYAHYSYSGMTEEELKRADRLEVFRLLREVVAPNARVDTWTVNGNTLVLTVTATSMQEANYLSLRLMGEDSVQYCSVLDANMDRPEADNNVLVPPAPPPSGAAPEHPEAGAAREEADALELAPQSVTAHLAVYLTEREGMS